MASAMIGWIRSRLKGASKHGELWQRAQEAYQRGALPAARQACAALLDESPRDVPALCLMSAIAAEEGLIDQARRWARQALAVAPESAAPHYAMGRVMETAHRYADAEASYAEAVRLDPRHAKAYNNLGAVQHLQGKLDAALACYRKALEIDPQQPQANQNYAAFVADPQARSRAIEGYQRTLEQNPADAAALNNLANSYVDLDRHDEALACLDRAIALQPERAEAHFSKAFLLLLRGDYERGWKEYEWRWRLDAFNASARRFAQPLWDGRPLPQGTILLHGETGFGDMLQLVRYAPLVAERCAAVVLECQPALQSLLQGTTGVHELVAQGAPLPQFAAHTPLIRLPGLFGTTLQDTAWSGPYVHAPEARVAGWRRALEADALARRRIGLVWAGNPENWADRRRSLELAMLAPLARVPDAAFYSLQKGKAAAQAASPPPGLRLVDHAERIRDFADTAALISLMDLVVTIDTSVAHLGGAMGAPTWVLLPQAADWRYHLERRDNPWYPTMRLFRQPREGDWGAAVESLVDELSRSPV